jgi:hypothetical protein
MKPSLRTSTLLEAAQEGVGAWLWLATTPRGALPFAAGLHLPNLSRLAAEFPDVVREGCTFLLNLRGEGLVAALTPYLCVLTRSSAAWAYPVAITLALRVFGGVHHQLSLDYLTGNNGGKVLAEALLLGICQNRDRQAHRVSDLGSRHGVSRLNVRRECEDEDSPPTSCTALTRLLRFAVLKSASVF